MKACPDLSALSLAENYVLIVKEGHPLMSRSIRNLVGKRKDIVILKHHLSTCCAW